LLENGANTSFVNRIADSTIAVESVVADPVAAAQSNATAANPKIPLPRDSVWRSRELGRIRVRRRSGVFPGAREDRVVRLATARARRGR
jgi:hypothetical protein